MTQPLTLETDRLILRPLGPQDAEGVVAFYMDERSSMVGGVLNEWDAGKMFYFLLGHWVHRGYGLWAVTLKGDDTAIGMVGPFFPLTRPETEIGWVMLTAEAEGKGYAAEAARAAIDDAWSRLGWTEMVHYIDPTNAASIKLAERLGAYLDEDAEQPHKSSPCLVYRQPHPETQGGMEAYA